MVRISRLAACAAVLALVGGAALIPRVSGQARPASGTRVGEWTHYTADVRGTRYSPLDQINAANFNKLEVAWRFKTDNLGPRPEYKLEGTPLMVKGVALHDRRHAPLGGRARREDRRTDLGLQPARRQRARRTRRASCRAAACPTGPTARATIAILYVTPGYRLVALNAQTGAADRGLRQERHRRPEGRRRSTATGSRSISRPARSACIRRRPSRRTS